MPRHSAGRKVTPAQLVAYLNERTIRSDTHLLWAGPVRTVPGKDGVLKDVPIANLPGLRNAFARGIAYRHLFPDTPKDMRVKQGCPVDLCIEPKHSTLTQSATSRVSEELAALPTDVPGYFTVAGTAKPSLHAVEPPAETWPDMLNEVAVLVPGKYYRCVACDTVMQVPSGDYRNRDLTTHNACGAQGQWEPADTPVLP